MKNLAEELGPAEGKPLEAHFTSRLCRRFSKKRPQPDLGRGTLSEGPHGHIRRKSSREALRRAAEKAHDSKSYRQLPRSERPQRAGKAQSTRYHNEGGRYRPGLDRLATHTAETRLQQSRGELGLDHLLTSEGESHRALEPPALSLVGAPASLGWEQGGWPLGTSALSGTAACLNKTHGKGGKAKPQLPQACPLLKEPLGPLPLPAHSGLPKGEACSKTTQTLPLPPLTSASTKRLSYLPQAPRVGLRACERGGKASPAPPLHAPAVIRKRHLKPPGQERASGRKAAPLRGKAGKEKGKPLWLPL